jgi:hypothetical protein
VRLHRSVGHRQAVAPGGRPVDDGVDERLDELVAGLDRGRPGLDLPAHVLGERLGHRRRELRIDEGGARGAALPQDRAGRVQQRVAALGEARAGGHHRRDAYPI